MAPWGIVEGRPISYHSQASHSQLPGWQYAMEVLRLCLVLHNRFNKEVWTTKSMSSRGGGAGVLVEVLFICVPFCFI